MTNIDYKKYFSGKKVTQLGLGLLGRGLGDAVFLAECGAELIVTDIKTEEELKTSVEKLKGYLNVTLHLGGHNIEDFKDRDFILKGAGVPLDSIYIEEAQKNNIPIEMDSSLFCKLLPKEVVTIGVTGTRGKSTVTHLINHILKTAGKKTILGGNIRDMATLPFIKDIIGDEIVVLELDSWQLQGFGDLKISPHISVFTAFMHDHVNYYKGDSERYFEDKANIYKYQNKNDILVAGRSVSSIIASKHPSTGEMIVASKEDVPQDWHPKIIGDHNLLNIACAIKVCEALNISLDDIKLGVESFLGVEGRLQLVKEINGVKIWNDNNATTPEATIAALKSVGSNTVLICGGADKGLDLKELIEEINKNCKSLVLVAGSGTKLLTTNDIKLTVKFVEVQNLSEAIKVGMENTTSGDNLLFSPAFASFGLFKNEYERNDEFLKIINEL